MERWFRRFSIRARLVGAAAMAGVALLLVSGVAVVAIQQLGRDFDDLFAREYAAQQRLAQLQLRLGEMRASEKDTVLAIDEVDVAKQHQQHWKDAVVQVREVLDKLRGPLPAEQVQRIDAAVERYAGLAGDVLQRGINGLIVTSTEQNQALGPARAELAAAQPLLDAAAARIESAASERRLRVARHASERPVLIAAAAGLTLLLLGATIALLIRSVTGPLAQAVAVARRVAHGELDNRLPTEGEDELAALTHALGSMQQSLRDIVLQLRDTSDAIAAASAQVRVGSQDLSQRTDRAAADLQRNAASVADLAALLQRTEGGAREASATSAEAARLAHEGVAVVGNVATRMEQLIVQSRRIADITGLIDTIAFQTNLLALNAAVEAARAGEHGRGFGVVAGEVRALAQRATQAASDIRDVIAGSVAEIASGAESARHAGDRMQDLIDAVGRVAEGMGALGMAAGAQSRDVAEVHLSMHALDGMTQQNAALVQQSAAASVALHAQAERLGRLVARFRVDGNGAVTSAPA